MSTKIIPRNKYALVRPDPEPSRESEHGIIMPTNVEQEQKAYGTVEAVGADIKDLKVGDRVIYGAYAGEKIKFAESKGEVDYILLLDEDIIAFIKKK